MANNEQGGQICLEELINYYGFTSVRANDPIVFPVLHEVKGMYPKTQRYV